MLVIGLTGGIATGKSTVSNYLLSLGLAVIDADIISREVVEPGGKGLLQLVQSFGSHLLQSNGQLDRAKLADLLFHDETIRRQVNDILHPLIYEAIFEQVADYRLKGEQAVFLDIPLLFESGELEYFDEIWLVYVPETVQLNRLMQRDHLSKEYGQARLASQLAIESKKSLADVIIDNTGSIQETYKQVETILKQRMIKREES